MSNLLVVFLFIRHHCTFTFEKLTLAAAGTVKKTLDNVNMGKVVIRRESTLVGVV